MKYCLILNKFNIYLEPLYNFLLVWIQINILSMQKNLQNYHLLQHFCQQSKIIQQNLLPQSSKEKPDTFIIQCLNSLPLDITKLLSTQNEQQKIVILKDSKYKEYLMTNKINKKWYYKILDEINIILQRLKKLNLAQITPIYKESAALKYYQKIAIYAFTFPQQDLLNLERNHERWIEMEKIIQYKTLATRQEMLSQIAGLQKFLNAMAASQQQIQQTESRFKKSSLKTFGILKNLMGEDTRNRKSIIFKMTMNPEKFKRFLNNAEQGFNSSLVSLIYDSIEYVQVIYICSLYEKITSQAILTWLKQEDQMNLKLEKVEQVSQVKKNDLFKEDPNKISIRILSDFKFKRLQNENQHKSDSEFVILHIHGGGFLALSPKSHQIYTRKWAKQCRIPIFSIDYKKTPQFPYPYALNEVWQAYNWIINESHKYFRLKPNKKILVMGDSAGGNLTLILTNLTIMKNIQKPYHIIPFYPATLCDSNIFNPSHLNTFYDPLLSHEFIELAMKIYVLDNQFLSKKNCLLSPLYTSNKILSKYPQTTIFIGQRDYLHDDTLKFVQKLKKNKGIVQLIIYKYMIHGFLNYGLPIYGLNCAKECVKDSILKILSIVTSNKK